MFEKLRFCYLYLLNTIYEEGSAVAKLNTIFKFRGTFNEVTSVRSKTYGDHIRAKRGTKKPAEVNKAFKESTARLKQVNHFAKVIKDALDPYREVFHDGTFWTRLLSLFRNQLKKTGKLSWSALKKFELIGDFRLNRRFQASVKVSFIQEENSLSIQVRSSSQGAPEKVPSDQYEQTVVVVFLGEKDCVQQVHDSVMLPVRRRSDNEYSHSWPIPPGATTAVVALGCSFFQNGERIRRRNMSAMTIVETLICK